MEQLICKAIIRKSQALLRKEEKRRYILGKYRTKFELRTAAPPTVTAFKFPNAWLIHSHFDPRYCLKNARFLARAIWSKIQTGSYEPLPAVRTDIPKPGGGTRTIMSFSIPDAAVSNVIYARLRDKNASLFSPFSYAYLKDRGLFDAVIQLRSYLKNGQNYLIEMDFSKYFDTIEHRYIDHVMCSGEFNYSTAELNVIKSFLKHRISTAKNYDPVTPERRVRGVPQGSSISLFLANLAGHALDRDLEATNGRFVRFADDVVVVTETHRDAIRALSAFEAHCQFSGISVNYLKSEGISLFSPRSKMDKRSFFIDVDGGHDMNVKESFDYLGHKFSRSNIQISSRALQRAKSRIAKIIYLNLIYSLQFGFSPTRINGVSHDWDLVTCVNELRRYIYGNITEAEIKTFIESGTRIRPLRGFVGFYSLVDSLEQFRELDGWMLDILKRGLKARYNKIAVITGLPQRTVQSKASLKAGDWLESELDIDATLPSFVRAWRAARKRFKLYGLQGLDNPSYYSDLNAAGSAFHYEVT